MSNLMYTPPASKNIARTDLIALLTAAEAVKASRFCRQAALVWLASYPGDLLVNYYLANSLVNEQRTSQAIAILENLNQADPEFDAARLLLEKIKADAAPADRTAAINQEEQKSAVKAQNYLEVSKKALGLYRLEEAETFAQKAFVADSESPRTAIHHIKVVRAKNDFQGVLNLANLYHQKWPGCIQFALLLAEAQLTLGNDTESVALLHQCTSKDIEGQVAKRIWGNSHPYQALWPANPSIHFNLQIPAEVSGAMGWNLLAQPVAIPAPLSDHADEEAAPAPVIENVLETSADTDNNPSAPSETTTKDSPHRLEHISAVQKELDHLAKKMKQPAISRSDGRFPMYIIFSHHARLEELYGAQTCALIDGMLKALAELIRKRPGWGAMVFYPDDPISMQALGLSPVESNDPWKMKLSLADLDQALTKKGSMIGAVLIVGGAQIVPFHELPNPTDDGDAQVDSDNPYATIDSNYFIPEWPVGRLPGEHGADSGLLLEQLRQITKYHNHLSKVKGWQKTSIFRRIGYRVASWIRPERHAKPSLGYTAQVWQVSSKSVYQPIQQGQALLACPPVKSGDLQKKKSLAAHFAYFNLHGISDGVEWFGQKSYASTTFEPDYPVALSPQDFLHGQLSPQIVFSEACYGANIPGKNASEAMALKFIASGTKALIGSTCIAYGSVTNPLIAADLLGSHFWNFIKKDMPVGFAFLRAKLALVKDMNKRQGYLDGEDQKTLISFILLGDPLLGATAKDTGEKAHGRLRSHPEVKLVTERHASADNFNLPSETLLQVKKIVDRYLPGLAEAEYNVSMMQLPETTPDQQPGGKKHGLKKQALAQHYVVTMNKKVEIARQIHGYYARFTIDAKGKVIKLATSR